MLFAEEALPRGKTHGLTSSEAEVPDKISIISGGEHFLLESTSSSSLSESAFEGLKE